MTPPPTSLPRRRAIGSAGALMAGSAVNGLAAYVFVAVGTRTFGAAAFAPVSVLWTFWALSVATFTFPVQHWIIRTVEVDGHEGSVRKELPDLIAATLGISVVLAVVAMIWRERLFGSTSLVWPGLVLAVGIGSALAGYLRGVLAGRKRFTATGTAIGAENLVRLLAGAVVVAVGASVGWFAAALVTGPVVVLAWPGIFRLRDGTALGDHRLAEFLGGLGGGALLAQVALNAGPAVLAAVGGAPEQVTGFFATLALFRAPYLVALGLATLLTGPLTALAVGGEEARLRMFRRRFLVATVAAVVAATALGFAVGPAIVDLVFGEGVAPSGAIVATISGGSTVALAALVALLMLVARGATSAIVRAWAVAMGAGLVVILVWPGDPLPAVAASFAVTEIVALALMVAADIGASRQSTRSRTT